MPQEKYDIAIVGAGVSGLLAAALLSRMGYRVIVLEKQYVLGGYLQGFNRKEFIFDTAIHWLNQYGQDGTVTRVFELLGDDFPRPQPMKTIQRHVGNNHAYTLTDNPDELQATLIRDFPHEEKGIRKFFQAAKRIAEVSKKFGAFFQSPETMDGWKIPLFRMKQLGIIYPLIPYAMYSGEEGVRKGLNKFFKDPGLHQLFCAEKDLLSCLFPIAWAYNQDYQNPPIGGSQVIPAWLEKQIAASGGEIRLSAEVKTLHFENDLFTGLTYVNRAKEQRIDAKFLIAACDIHLLYNKLFPEAYRPKKFLEKLQTAEMYSSSVTISIALNCLPESLGFGHELTLLTLDDIQRMEHSGGDPHKSAISILAPSVRDNTMAPEGKGTLTLYVPAWMAYENEWKTERKPNGTFVRTPEYKALKESFAQIIFDRVEKALQIDLRSHIDFYEVATPITYERYSENKGGTMMGARPGKHNMQQKVAHYQTPIKNIVVGGQWAELGGGVPIATKAGYNASLLALKYFNKSQYKQLIEAFEKRIPL